MTGTNLALPKLQHVTITFPPGEERRLRDFYINVIGFKEKPVPEVAKPLGWIWFHTGAGAVELHTVPDTTALPKDPTHHFCIEVDDLDRYRSALTKAGFEIALRAGEIDIGITNESGELLAGEFYTRKLAEEGSYIALPEQHRLVSRDQVSLSDLKGDFFVSIDSHQAPSLYRRLEAYCRKYGRFRPKFHSPAQNLSHGVHLVANENAVFLLPAFAFYLWRTRR